MCSKDFFKDLSFLQLLLKDFTEIFHNSHWGKYTFQKNLSEIYGYFSQDCNSFSWKKYTKP